MPVPAPAPIENPHLQALEEETMRWLKKADHNIDAVILRRESILELLRAAVYYEEELYERTRHLRLETQAERLIVVALSEFILRPSPEWHVEPATHWAHVRRLIVTLPKTLDAVWEWSGRPSSVTLDAVNQWLKENIATICPYICPA